MKRGGRGRKKGREKGEKEVIIFPNTVMSLFPLVVGKKFLLPIFCDSL